MALLVVKMMYSSGRLLQVRPSLHSETPVGQAHVYAADDAFVVVVVVVVTLGRHRWEHGLLVHLVVVEVMGVHVG